MKTMHRTMMIGLLLGAMGTMGCAFGTDERASEDVEATDEASNAALPSAQVPMTDSDQVPSSDVIIGGETTITIPYPTTIPGLRCGDPSQYINTPMWLNDGSQKYIPIGGIVPAGSGTDQPIILEVGATLTAITVRIAPALHTDLTDMLLPYLELRKVDKYGKVTKVGDLAWDPNGEPYTTWNPGAELAAGFSKVHTITMPLAEVVDGQYYYLTFAQEWGGGQARNGVVCGTMVTVTPAAQ